MFRSISRSKYSGQTSNSFWRNLKKKKSPPLFTSFHFNQKAPILCISYASPSHILFINRSSKAHIKRKKFSTSRESRLTVALAFTLKGVLFEKLSVPFGMNISKQLVEVTNIPRQLHKTSQLVLSQVHQNTNSFWKWNKILSLQHNSLYNLRHLPKVLHKLCKCLSSSSKGYNNVYDWSRNINRFTLHFHEGSKRSEQRDMSVFHAIHLLIKQLILCPLISFSTIVTWRVSHTRIYEVKDASSFISETLFPENYEVKENSWG